MSRPGELCPLMVGILKQTLMGHRGKLPPTFHLLLHQSGCVHGNRSSEVIVNVVYWLGLAFYCQGCCGGTGESICQPSHHRWTWAASSLSSTAKRSVCQQRIGTPSSRISFERGHFVLRLFWLSREKSNRALEAWCMWGVLKGGVGTLRCGFDSLTGFNRS